MERKAGERRRGRLTREDVRLWSEVARTVRARPGAALPPADEPSPPPERESAVHVAPPRPAPAPPRAATLPLAPLEKTLRRRLSRGQAEVDMKIDLHGMRQAEAHAALREFLHRARARHAKVVLVVTGKGGRAPEEAPNWSGGIGVLRRSVPIWLAAPDLRAIVLGFEEAAPSQGGGGALYVRLRGARRDREPRE